MTDTLFVIIIIFGGLIALVVSALRAYARGVNQEDPAQRDFWSRD